MCGEELQGLLNEGTSRYSPKQTFKIPKLTSASGTKRSSDPVCSMNLNNPKEPLGLCYRSLFRNNLSSEKYEQCPGLGRHVSMAGIKRLGTKSWRISVVMGKGVYTSLFAYTSRSHIFHHCKSRLNIGKSDLAPV